MKVNVIKTLKGKILFTYKFTYDFICIQIESVAAGIFVFKSRNKILLELKYAWMNANFECVAAGVCALPANS